MAEKVLYYSPDGIDEKEISTGSAETANVEALSADKTLTASDAPIQMYTCTANRIVNLPTTGVAVGQKFEIWNKNAYTTTYYLQIKQGATTHAMLYAENNEILRWDGTNWVVGTGNYNVSFGLNAKSYNGGLSIGRVSSGHTQGTSIGNSADGSSGGLAAGYSANTNAKSSCTVASGMNSKAERNREFVSTATYSTTNKAQLTFQKYMEKDLATAAAAWQELFIDASSARLAIIASSVYNFKAQINAIDVTNKNVKCWEITGCIKRDAANATSLVGTPTVTVIGADTAAANWDARITADDTNEALKVEVKHDSANNVRFSLNIYATETRI